MSTHNQDCSEFLDFIDDKIGLFNKAYQRMTYRSNPISWVAHYIVAYGLFEKVCRSFYLDGTTIVQRTQTRNFSERKNDSTLIGGNLMGQLQIYSGTRQKYAHGDFLTTCLTSLDLEILKGNLKNLKDEIKSARDQILHYHVDPP